MTYSQTTQTPPANDSPRFQTPGAIALSVISFLAGIYLSITVFQEANALVGYLTFGIYVALTLISVVNFLLALRGRAGLSLVIGFYSVLLIMVSGPALVTGRTLPSTISTLTILFILAFWLLPRASRRWYITLAVLGFALAWAMEWFAPPWRISLGAAPIGPAVAILFGILLVIIVLAQAWRGSLRNKLTVAFIGLTAISISLLGAFVILTTINNTQATLERELTTLVTTRATRLGDLFNEQVNKLITLTLNEELQLPIEEQNESYGDDEAEIRASLQAKDQQWITAYNANDNNDPLIRQVLGSIGASDLEEYRRVYPDNIELFVTDVHGGLVAASSRTSDYDQSDEAWWQAAYNNGEGAVYISEPQLDDSTRNIAIQIAIPINNNENDAVIGVLRTTYLLRPLQSILAQEIGQTSFIDLYLPGEKPTRLHGNIFETADPQLFEQVQALPNQKMVEMTYDGSPSVVTQARIQSLENTPYINNLNWVVVFSQHRDEAFSSVTLQIQGVVVVIVVVVLLSIIAAFLMAQILIRPIAQLNRTAQEIAAGNLNSQVQVSSSDEIGDLGTSFNLMTERLRELVGSLEQRVAERTAKMERRNLDLALATQIGQTVSQVRAINDMLQDAAEIIRAFFGLYYVQIYLVNQDQTDLVLQFGTGEVGQELLRIHHHLPLDENSVNGRAAVTKQPVIIPNTQASPIFRPNPLLPETRSEIAVPLMIGDKLIGVLDAQSEQPGKLDDESLLAFEPMAGQIAIAVQNARLVQETEQARAEVEALAKRLTRSAWTEYLDAIHKPEVSGFVFENNEITPLENTPAAPEASETALLANITVTGEAVGQLVVELENPNTNEQGSELLNVVARQVAQHIESLRLIENAERYRQESEEAARRLTRESWDEFLASRSGKRLGYAYDLREVKPLTGEEEMEGINLPLKIRDEAMGQLVIPGIAPNDKESLEFARVVAERLSEHLETLRLAEQTRERARREQALRQITSAVRGSTNPESIIRTAVRELGNLLGRKTAIRLATPATGAPSAATDEQPPAAPTQDEA